MGNATFRSTRLPRRFRTGPLTLLALCLFGFVLFSLWACELTSGKRTDTASFDQLYDNLSQYDSVVIVFRDGEGKFLDTVFSGKVDSHAALQDLKVDGWDGGKARILISGFNAGILVYQIEKKFDGGNNQVDANILILDPASALNGEARNLTLREGDSLPFPRITVRPDNLSDKSLFWRVTDTNVLQLGTDFMKARSQGPVTLTAKLRSDSAKIFAIQVSVIPKGGVPPDTTSTGATDTTPTVPGAPKVLVTPSGVTNNAKPVWSWTGAGGTGYQFRLDSNNFSASGAAVADTSFTPSAPLSEGSHTLYVREKNSAGTWSPVGSASVTVDLTPPPPPKVFGTSPTNTTPKWTWSGSGAGIFRYRLADSVFTASDKETGDTIFTLATAASGSSYTMYVAERDAAGNWSGTGSKTIRYDLTQPVVSILSPQASGTYFTASPVAITGTATGPAVISKVTYRIGTGNPANAVFSAPNWSIPAPALQEGSPTQITVTATDNAGNSGEAIVSLFLDATAPAAPTLASMPAAAIAALKANFGWNPGSDGANGSGPNGRYRYNLNGGAWKDTTAALLQDLPLKEGSNLFSVQEQDKALNWSASATHSVLVDTVAPVLTLTSHSNPVTLAAPTITLAGQVRDSGGAGMASMAISGQSSGSGVVAISGSTWTATALTLNPGANTLRITATDQAGNSRILSVQVTVNVPASAVIITNPSDSLTVTNLDTIRVTYTIDGMAGNKLFNLPKDSVYRLVVTSPPNASGAMGRDTVKVTRDATPPKVPTLNRGRTPTNDSAIWSWTSNGDNAGGAGMRSPDVYRYSLNNGTSWTETSLTRYKATTEGSYTLIVQERDRAGNWSASSQEQTIVVDKTAPTVAIQTRNNYITNRAKVLIQYTVNNAAAGPALCDLTKADESNTCTVTSTDAAGNVGSASITVWYRPNTWFFKANGTGPGSTWDSASSDFGIFKNPGMDGKEIWVASGQYTASMPFSDHFTILGGFDPASYPFNSSNRNKSGTKFIGTQHLSGQSIDAIVIDGWLEVSGNTTQLTDVTISPTDLVATGLSVRPGNLVANNLVISGKTFNGDAILIQGSTVSFNGGSITKNQVGSHFNAIRMLNSELNLTGNFNVSENTWPTDPFPAQIAVYDGSVLKVGKNVVLDCKDRNVGVGLGDLDVIDSQFTCGVGP